jgi:hypothetical protein
MSKMVCSDRQASEHDVSSTVNKYHIIFLCMFLNMKYTFIKIIGPSVIAVSIEPFLRNFNSQIIFKLNTELMFHICDTVAHQGILTKLSRIPSSVENTFVTT